MPSEGRHSWHSRAPPPPLSSPGRVTLSDDYGPGVPTGGWTSPRGTKRRRRFIPAIQVYPLCFDTSAEWSKSSCRDASRADSDTRADRSLRHRRDGNAGTTILYHLRNRRRPHSSSGMTAGRRGCWGWAPPPLPLGLQDLPRDYRPDGAAGGLSRSTPRRADHATTRPSGAGRHFSPTTGTRSQTTCYVRRGTGRVVHCLIIAHSFLEHRSPISVRTYAIQKEKKGWCSNVNFFIKIRYV